MRESYLNEIKSFEGFAAQAKWDYAQFTNGYGTKARFEGERIDQAEASRRFSAELAEARKFVDKHTEGWDEGTKSALTSLTFNAGTRWASSGLGEAVRSFDVDAVRERFLSYTKAGGVDLPGLVRRRLEEVTWIGNDGSIAPPRAVMVANSEQAIQGAIAGQAGPEPLLAGATDVTTNNAVPQAARIDATSTATVDPRTLASLSLILLALDLAAAPALVGDRRENDGNSRPEQA